jgi:hypothetical protein
MSASLARATERFALDRYEIPIQSRSVSRVFVQSGFDIQMFEDGTELTIRIESPIAVVTENPRPLVRMEDELIPAMGVYGRIAISGSALRSETRMLDIIFHSGVWFQVEPKYQPESWGPYGSKGLIIICMPGSEMAVWFGMRKNG